MIAFTRPAAMSAPECPPRAPESFTRSVGSAPPPYVSGSLIDVWSLPAQPTVTASLAPSRLTSSRPDTSAASSAFAPSSPCSSETVRSSSSGPCATAGSSASASASATPMPLSAPSVVPSARTQSSSTWTSIRPSRGSNRLSGSRSHTMSRCAWRTTTGAASRPDVAGTETTTFPSASVAVATPRSAAQARTCCCTCSSAFDGRAMRVSSEKRSQTSAGSSPASGELTVGA